MGKVFYLVTALILLGWLLSGCSDTPTEEAPATATRTVATTVPSPTATETPQQIPTQEPPSIPEPVEEETQIKLYDKPGDYLDSLLVDGFERWFIVHLPPQYEAGTPMPMVINLHGRGSNAIQMRDASQMNVKADEEGFIVVYPQSLGEPATWFGVLFGDQGEPDMNFFRDLVPYLQAEMSVDPARIFVTGISNGASMANRLGCEMSNVFAAIAPVAGAHSGMHLCDNEQPLSVLAIHGTDDPIIPFDGTGSDVPSVPEWVWAWADRNGCQGDPVCAQPFDNVIFESWEGCDAETAVGLYTIEGGGHTWLALVPGTADTGFAPEVSATDAMWDFFQSHPKQMADQ
jgi:polyhydroxybutyrate depolymerase